MLESARTLQSATRIGSSRTRSSLSAAIGRAFGARTRRPARRSPPPPPPTNTHTTTTHTHTHHTTEFHSGLGRGLRTTCVAYEPLSSPSPMHPPSIRWSASWTPTSKAAIDLPWNRAHFAAWCITSSPLDLGLDFVDHAAQQVLEQVAAILTHPEYPGAIAVNQAWAGSPGQLLTSSTRPTRSCPTPPVLSS